MSRQKELARNTAVLTFGKICTQCISFLLLPLYTAVLETAEYGTFDLFITYGTLLLPLVNWQFDQGIFRFMLDCRSDKIAQKRLFSTVLTVNVIQSIVFAIILSIASVVFHIANGFFLILYVVFNVITALLLQFARGLGENKVYAMASFVSATTTITLNVVTLVIFEWALAGLFVATVVAQLFTIIYLCVVIKPWDYFSFKYISKDVFVQVRQYSVPMISNNLAWWVVNVSDRTIVSYVLGVGINGIYTVANKFSNVFVNFYNIFNLSWTETVSLHFNDEDRDSFISETMTTMYKLFASACFGIVACMPFAFPVMVNTKYAEAYPHIIILMYAMLMRVVVGLYTTIYVAQKESKKIAYTAIISAVINVVVNLLFIGRIGLYAASISTFIAFGSMAMVRCIDINKSVSIKISNPVLISSLLVGVVLGITYYINNLVVNTIALLGVIIYVIVLDWPLIIQVWNIIKNRLNKF